VQYNVDLDYDYWTAGACVLQYIFQHSGMYVEECLHSFLPEELRGGAPTGFAMTGHIGLLFPCRIY
jgi:tRNA (guanine37-N1)-methyltransferase